MFRLSISTTRLYQQKAALVDHGSPYLSSRCVQLDIRCHTSFIDAVSALDEPEDAEEYRASEYTVRESEGKRNVGHCYSAVIYSMAEMPS